MMNLSDLHKPFPPEAVSWRVGSMTKDKSKGLALAYIDARDVMTRLDEVCGPANWQAAYPHANGKTICSIGIKVGGEWVWKANGAGDTDIEAEKGAISDAFKRAAVLWGIGRYLYDVKSPWVALDEYKAIKPEEMAKLNRILRNGQSLPAPVLPPAPAERPTLDSTKPPEGIITDLWQTAVERALAGMLAYQSFWQNDTSKDERLSLNKHHEALKALAVFSDTQANRGA